MLTEISPRFLLKVLRTVDSPGSVGDRNCDRTSVFLLVYNKNKIPYILAILKADTPGYAWRNQVALPGGHIDKADSSPMTAAYRELEEELGILKSQIHFIGSLGHFQTIQQKDIEVFVGIWEGDTKKINYDPIEISRILEIPVETLLKTHISSNFHGRTPGIGELIYPLEDTIVWGVTARIFHYFLELLMQTPLKAD